MEVLCFSCAVLTGSFFSRCWHESENINCVLQIVQLVILYVLVVLLPLVVRATDFSVWKF